ncbi:unnamed protein product [Mytilus edulis]|uniref:Ig-like domain-containing protein n=1 Tax=Mytilus edulis TaxID=6550 RepID=A0A8S3RIC6_MYTED|nr:unnamed protein product [Mytilus edulis]
MHFDDNWLCPRTTYVCIVFLRSRITTIVCRRPRFISKVLILPQSDRSYYDEIFSKRSFHSGIEKPYSKFTRREQRYACTDDDINIEVLVTTKQSILSDSTCSSITSYATEGSTINLTFSNEKHEYRWYGLYTRNNEGTEIFSKVNASKYDIKVHPPVSEFQIINVTASDKGYYWYSWHKLYEIELNITNLFIVNQTDLKTIVGQEGKEMEIKCSTNTVQYITGLNIESNGSIMEIGDNQSVSFLFIPDRTDHLTTYKCVDITHSSIMTEVKLIIRYAPVVTGHLTNETIKCDCDGFPEKYSVYRLDQISNYGELVRSVNLNTEIFTFHTDPLPYQRNGRYMCFVSNGIPDTTGKVLQTWSTDVKYEGPPIFSPGNRNVKHGEVGISISMSFYIYSYPAVDEVNIEKIGQKQSKNEILRYYNIINSTLRYTEFNNIIGTEGYEIVIESEVLEIYDFHAYLITVKNHLGENHLPLSNRKMTFFMIICSIATVIFVYMTILHICLCIKLKKTRSQRHAHEHEDHTYHTYDEIGTLSYRAARTIHWSETSESVGQNAVHQHAAHISNETNALSTDNSTAELDADFIVGELLQSEVTDVQRQRQHVSTSSDDTNLPNTDFFQIPPAVISSMDNIVNCNKSNANAETLSDQTSQSCSDSDSDMSNNVMIGNRGDGYENPYQTVLQTRPESHRYVEIANERHTSISSTDSNKSEEQILQTGSTKEAVYINLQF